MKVNKVLQGYGLNQKQVQVYLTCLELGSASAHKISQKSELVRTTVYEVLEALRKKGFVSTYLKKKVKYYSAEDPEQIISKAQLKVDRLNEVLPELNALVGQSRKRPAMRFYQGKEELKIVMQEILAEAKELSVFGAADKYLEEIGTFHEKTFLKQRLKQQN